MTGEGEFTKDKGDNKEEERKLKTRWVIEEGEQQFAKGFLGKQKQGVA